ncbi:MAG: type 2 isopentenyl-diphosphate Delta-isomerase [Firmicutes bacterium]|nr:type 2 isopentenyl-diphosphate Delta-isomerase [Bacillota bacterium]
MRQYRKREHVENYLKTEHRGDPLFSDIYLPNISLPELAIEEIDTSTTYLGKEINFPLMINAITGGTEFAENINSDLAELAKRLKIPMAVGSETIAMEDEASIESFKIVRDIIGEEGIVVGNMNANLTPEQAEKAVDIIDADALQIHLNPAQELAMEEGDRDFRGMKDRILTAKDALEVPVIVKEVGFGLDASVIETLYEAGIRHVDISGYGGTNFFEVENMRYVHFDMTDLYEWGIPTAYALARAVALEKDDLHITASGGIRTALDLVKCLVLGADMCAISGEILKYIVHGGIDYAEEYLEELIHKSKIIMLLLACKDIESLRDVAWRPTGRLLELLRS